MRELKLKKTCQPMSTSAPNLDPNPKRQKKLFMRKLEI